MAHTGPYQRCDASRTVCNNFGHASGNIEPRLLNESQPYGWEHPLGESNLVETHELIHLFGIYWHSSARLCEAGARDFRECRHR